MFIYKWMRQQPFSVVNKRRTPYYGKVLLPADKKGAESNDSAPFSLCPRLPYTRNDAFALGIATFYSPIHYADIRMQFV